MPHQMREIKKQLLLHCIEKGHYKLASAIDAGDVLNKASFMTAMPDPAQYSTLAKVNSDMVLRVTDPALKFKVDTI
jgi:hypothetical protein